MNYDRSDLINDRLYSQPLILSVTNEKGRSMKVTPSSLGEVYLALAVVGSVLMMEMAAFALLG
jgi:hypothetical protein